MPIAVCWRYWPISESVAEAASAGTAGYVAPVPASLGRPWGPQPCPTVGDRCPWFRDTTGPDGGRSC